MQISRSILAALAVATIALSVPALAHTHRTAQFGPSPGFIDAAAIPAYPADHQARTTHTHRQAHSHRVASTTSTYRSDDEDSRAEQPSVGVSGGGIVRSHKTGATARVSVAFASTAQAVVDDLEQNYGAAIKFMGGYRRGPCASWSLHPCGLAIDLCQLARGVVDGRCNMPSRAIEEKVARAHGAYSGGEWCNNDRGHIQAKETAAPCGHNLYAAVTKFKGTTEVAARHRVLHKYHRVRFARR